MDPALAPSAARPLCVLKFGGSVLTTRADYALAGAEAYRHVRDGETVIIIVSALQGETDALFAEAEAAGAGACPAMTARLVRLGEYRSAALMGLELARLGVRARVLDPHEIALEAEGDPLDADLVRLDRKRLDAALRDVEAVVLPGFTAGHARHGAVTLGRGGTDLTAVFFAAQAGARRVRLIKDVDGVYTDDPARDPAARRYDRLDYDAALKASRGLIQPKAIEAARAAGLEIEIAAMGAGHATRVAPGPAVIGAPVRARPLRVALLGCGAVGSGVLDHLIARPDLFVLNPVLVRRPERRADDRRAAFTANADRALADAPDLVIEAMGGVDQPAGLMLRALAGGAHVVTANKAALAARYEALKAGARMADRRLQYAASVGGGVVVLEALDRLRNRGVLSVEGVMNGTGNFILSRLRAGAAFDDAVAEAQRLGFAEADPSADVEGLDAADKLSLLIREAFGRTVPPGAIARQSLRDATPARIADAASRGEVFKQVGRCALKPDGSVEASVRVMSLPLAHPLAGAVNEENRFVVTLADGSVHALYGKGAGRWPTAAAVFADVMDIARACACDGPRRAALAASA
ncbi:MAG: homoserine dehydrogenase [Alphaproteobacteria bacterium]|nr:homoserine dehydrogenase [Alphaproteobacteria bacterium]